MFVIWRFPRRAFDVCTSCPARYFAHHVPVIGHPIKASVSEKKAKTPVTIWKLLGQPSRRTRFAIVGLTIPLAVVIAGWTVKEPTTSDELFSPQYFTPCTLTSRELISSTSSILTLEPIPAPKSSDPYSDFWKKGLWSLEFKQPQLQIARSYTPLPPWIDTDNDAGKDNAGSELRFLIRHDGRGEVSNYLNALRLGSNVELRGPRIEYQLPEEIDDIVFLAGGTGIGPALQTLQTLVLRKAEPGLQIPRVRILWANRKREDCVGGLNAPTSNASFSLPWRLFPYSSTLVKKSENLKPPATTVESHNPIVHALLNLKAEHPERISIEFYVDEENTQIDSAAIKRHIGDLKPTHDHVPNRASKPGQKLIMVSGPDGFVEHLAGPKGWRLSVQVQGDLGGVLGQMNPEGWEVRKL